MAESTRSETVPNGAPSGPARGTDTTDTSTVVPDVHDPLAAPGAAGAPGGNGQTGAQEAPFVGRPTIRGQQFMISSVHYLATMGGLRLLTQGGNAVDAGVGAGICINVVQPQLAMFGGVAPIIISPAPQPSGTPPARRPAPLRRWSPSVAWDAGPAPRAWRTTSPATGATSPAASPAP